MQEWSNQSGVCFRHPDKSDISEGKNNSEQKQNLSFWMFGVCGQQEGDSLGAMEKVCRQLTYHLSPHSQWRRQGLLKRKPQAWWVCLCVCVWVYSLASVSVIISVCRQYVIICHGKIHFLLFSLSLESNFTIKSNLFSMTTQFKSSAQQIKQPLI